jgi:hypothetical protein
MEAQEAQAKSFFDINRALKRALAKTFGEQWRQFDAARKDAFLQDSLDFWIKGDPEDPRVQAPGVVAALVVIERGRPVYRPIDRKIDKDRLDASAREAALHVRRKFLAIERPGKKAQEEADIPYIATLQQRLRDETLAPGDALRTAIILLHHGEQVFDTQPTRLLGQQKGEAYRDLRVHHPERYDDVRCPSCRAIKKFLRYPGLDAAEVARIVDQFLLEVRAARPNPRPTLPR